MNKKVWIGMLIVVLGVSLLFFLKKGNTDQKQDETTTESIDTTVEEESEESTVDETTTTEESATEESEMEESSTVVTTEESETEEATTQKPSEEETEPVTERQTIEPSEPYYESYEKEEAPYEHWLAAATITAISMNYFDFQDDIVYMASETDLKDSKQSQGVYVVFTSEGQQVCVKTMPLEEGRTEKGTMDLYAFVIGYASFEVVPMTSIEESVFHPVKVENMNTLIGQLEQVILYEN